MEMKKEKDQFNELNKFLSYIHMGNETFRIYYKQSDKMENESLKKLIVDTQETFKKHEEEISSYIASKGYTPSDSLTMAGEMGVLYEKLKMTDSSFDVCNNAIKAINMGELNSIKFLHENNELPEEVKHKVLDVLEDYKRIRSEYNDYLLQNYC